MLIDAREAKVADEVPQVSVCDTSSTQRPSDTLKAHPSLMRTFEGGQLSLEECERRALGCERLRELYSSIPYYAQRAARDPDYWSRLYDSRVNW